MKFLLLSLFSFCSLLLLAQSDTARKIEPGQQTSYDKYGLLIIAIVGLLLLMGLRFWFKRRRESNRRRMP